MSTISAGVHHEDFLEANHRVHRVIVFIVPIPSD